MLLRLRSLFSRHKFQADAVDTVALVGGGVKALARENMAEVAVALRAVHIDANHAAGGIALRDYVFSFGWIIKGRPSAMGIAPPFSLPRPALQ